MFSLVPKRASALTKMFVCSSLFVILQTNTYAQDDGRDDVPDGDDECEYLGLDPAPGMRSWCIAWATEMGYDPCAEDCPPCPCSTTSEAYSWNPDWVPGGGGDVVDPPEEPPPDLWDPPGPDEEWPEDCACILLQSMLRNMASEDGSESIYDVIKDLQEEFSTFSSEFSSYREAFDSMSDNLALDLDAVLAKLDEIISLLQLIQGDTEVIAAHTATMINLLTNIQAEFLLLNDYVFLEFAPLFANLALDIEDIVDNSLPILVNSIADIDQTTSDQLVVLQQLNTLVDQITADVDQISVDITSLRETAEDIYDLFVDDDEEDPTPAPSLENNPVEEFNPSTYVALTISGATDATPNINPVTPTIESNGVIELNPPAFALAGGSIQTTTWAELYGDPITADLTWMDTTDIFGVSIRAVITTLCLTLASIGSFYIIGEEFRRYG